MLESPVLVAGLFYIFYFVTARFKFQPMSNDLSVKLSLYGDMVAEKNVVVDTINEEIKRLENYAKATKDTAERLNLHIVAQKVEVQNLLINHKITQDMANAVLSVIENFSRAVRTSEEDAVRNLFLKQGEAEAARRDLAHLLSTKKNLEVEAKRAFDEELKRAKIAEQEARAAEERRLIQEKEKAESIKNSTPKVGRPPKTSTTKKKQKKT